MEQIKVFITEDESIVREGLRDIVPWEQYGFTFVGDAPDGEIALPLIRKLRPDVLITDIKMPFMDGLALSRIVSQELPDTKIIILSGYSDFDYARQAIALNVDQYLLKPITKAAIVKALELTRQKIEEEQEQKEYLRRYEEDMKTYENFSRRAFFERLVGGSMAVPEILSEAAKLDLDLTAQGYNFVLFTLHGKDGNAYSEEAARALDSLLDYFLCYPGYILFQNNLMSYAALILGRSSALDGLTRQALDIIEGRCAGLSWYAAVGTPVGDLSELARCYAETNRALAYRHLLPDTHIFHAKMLKAAAGSSAGHLDKLDPKNIDPMIIRNFLQTGTPDETEAFVSDYLTNLGGAENALMFRHYILMSARINTEVVLQQLGCTLEEFSDLPQPEDNRSPEKVQEYLVGLLNAALSLRDRKSQQENNDIINTAIRYIDKNYADENISLNSVAQAINISANYFSALFSQKMEVSFVEYLTRKRMERAKELLQKTALRSSEIAYQVGYHDPRYFSFVFRKTQGCTPRDYRAGEAEAE